MFTSFIIFRTLLVAVLMTAGVVGLFRFEYAGELAAGLTPDRAAAEAQTMAVTTVIMFQIFYLLDCRSLKGSIRRIGLFSNPAVFIGITVVLLLQAMFIFLPVLHRIFGSAPIAAGDIALATLVGASIVPVISVEKWWRNRGLKSP